jgi:hypothetical protein
MGYSFDHMVMVKYLPLTTSFQGGAFQQSFTKELAKLIQEIPSAVEALPDNEGWNINSHSLAFAGNTAIISILFQRGHK